MRGFFAGRKAVAVRVSFAETHLTGSGCALGNKGAGSSKRARASQQGPGTLGEGDPSDWPESAE